MLLVLYIDEDLRGNLPLPIGHNYLTPKQVDHDFSSASSSEVFLSGMKLQIRWVRRTQCLSFHSMIENFMYMILNIVYNSTFRPLSPKLEHQSREYL
jgi:hypothetical protein